MNTSTKLENGAAQFKQPRERRQQCKWVASLCGRLWRHFVVCEFGRGLGLARNNATAGQNGTCVACSFLGQLIFVAAAVACGLADAEWKGLLRRGGQRDVGTVDTEAD